MSKSEASRDAFAEAIELVGGQAAFAKRLSGPDRQISQQLVSYWLKKGEIPADLVLSTELLTGVSRFRLRPDVFCIPDWARNSLVA